MKAKIWNGFLAGIWVISLIIGCSKDNLTDNGRNPTPGDARDVAYVNVNVALPLAKGTRSTTQPDGGSNDGTEPGLPGENTVRKILLVLATSGNGYGTHGTIDLSSPASETTLKTSVPIDLTSLERFYEDGRLKASEQNGINVYVFCNPPEELVSTLDKLGYGDAWVDAICKYEKNVSIWADGSFLMSNALPAKRKIPVLSEAWKLYESESSAFDLSGYNNGNVDNYTNAGPVKVERSVARFDFKDGSSGNNTYDIGVGDDKGLLQIRLYRMALVNMSKEFYYLRRVSDNGLSDGDNFAVCGTETHTNFVVDTDAGFKNGSDLSAGTLRNHFSFPLFDNDEKITESSRKSWDNYWIDDVLGNSEDNEEYGKTGYRIWRYVTENSIPTNDNQRVGISTGIVFKGKLLAGSGLAEKNKDLADAINGNYAIPEDLIGNVYTYNVDNKAYPILYVFQNVIYVGWNAGVKKAADEDDSQESDLYKACYKTVTVGGVGKTVTEFYNALVQAKGTDGENAALAAFREAATSAGFTLYQASDDGADNVEDSHDAGVGYYCYYYYWNRHNDNGRINTMGPMEFAVVRNNVYKLMVTGITKLGHPRISDNDPDPLDPEDPDENGDVYLTVSVDVLPWVVRENNIEF